MFPFLRPFLETLIGVWFTVDKSGVLLTLGINCFGQLGVGDDHTERKKPALVEGALAGHTVVNVAAGGMHTIALCNDGQVSSPTGIADFSSLEFSMPLIDLLVWMQR